MPNSNRVLIVDDDEFARKILAKSLQDSFELEFAADGEEAIKVAESWSPGAILLDVELPGRNGYEVCDYLKQQPKTADIPILFLSSHSSLRERMLGYEVGADDYLVKPCDKEVLMAKLRRVRNYVEHKDTLQSSYDNAQQTAIEAITSSSELGKAVRFIERSYLAPTMERLGQDLLTMMRDLELSASVMFVARSGNYFCSSNTGEVAPLEKELLQMLHSEQRFVDFGCRTQVNYPRVALLVKNMPLQDRSRYGRLKDTIPFVLGATDAKVRVIDAELSFKQQNIELNQAVDEVRKSLMGITDMLVGNQRDVGDIMTALNTSLSLEMHRLGLEEDQEDYILDQFSDASQGISQTLVRGNEIMDSMHSLVEQLEHLAINQHQIITETLTVEQDEADPGNDIELF